MSHPNQSHSLKIDSRREEGKIRRYERVNLLFHFLGGAGRGGITDRSLKRWIWVYISIFVSKCVPPGQRGDSGGLAPGIALAPYLSIHVSKRKKGN